MRKFNYIFAFLVILSLSACSTTRSVVDHSTFTPMEAIEAAAASAPDGVHGTFQMTVQATGEVRDEVFLNSELDYRDQRNLTISISPPVATAFENKFGMNPAQYFEGKSIRVTGEAKRVTTWFTTDGRRSDKYYYQTHVRVTDPEQIQTL